MAYQGSAMLKQIDPTLCVSICRRFAVFIGVRKLW